MNKISISEVSCKTETKTQKTTGSKIPIEQTSYQNKRRVRLICRENIA
jgi:hypothetical protein